MSGIEVLLNSFNSLNQTERNIYLTKLPSRFWPSDWWTLSRIMLAHKNQQDIVGTLPMEISADVLEYLEPKQLIQCRRVCKRWNDVLKSDSVCAALVKRWCPRDVKLHSAGKPWHWILDNAMSRDQRVLEISESRSWKLHSREMNLFSLISGNSFTRPISFLDQRAAYVSYIDGASFNLRDLVTKKFLIRGLYSPARTVLDHICLMKNYIMATTGNSTCYIWKIDTQECKTVRLPNTNFDLFMADGDLFIATPRGQDQDILYNAVTNKTISIGPGCRFSSIKANVLDSRRQRVTSLKLSAGKELRIETYCTQTGDMIEQETVTLPEDIRNYSQMVNTNSSYGEHFYTVYMVAFSFPAMYQKPRGWLTKVPGDGLGTYALIYDRQTGRLLHQRLFFKGIRTIPAILHMYDGTVHMFISRTGETAVAMHVPMSTDSCEDEFYTVRTRVGVVRTPQVAFKIPLHVISPGLVVFGYREKLLQETWDVQWTCVDQYCGVRELEELGGETSDEDNDNDGGDYANEGDGDDEGEGD